MNTAATNQRAAFANAEECRAWLTATSLGNPVQGQAQLLRQLNLLNRQSIAATERFTILELLRKLTVNVQEEVARRFMGKALPLVPPEHSAYDASQALWQAQLGGYVICIKAALAGDAALKSRLAQLIERAMTVLAAAQIDIYRAGFQPRPEHWQALHELYETAERTGIAKQDVEDRLRQGNRPTSVLSVYAEVMLLHAASPHELPLRHFVWVARWAQRWAAKVSIQSSVPGADSPVRALCVDLASTEPANYSVTGGSGMRWLDTAEVRLSLKKRLSLLDKGMAPAELQLGDDCVQPACGQVLKRIYQRWCKGGIARSHERQAVSGTCEVIAGVDAIHYYLSGRKSFRQPGFADDEALRRDREELATFGRVTTATPEHFSTQQGFRAEEWQVIEEWQMVDESATGIHVTQGVAQTNARMGQGQLLALRPEGTQGLLLGCLRWTMVTNDARLHAGILVIPGQPDAVAYRVMDTNNTQEPYRPGFLLPAITALAAPVSIIVGSGMFKTGRPFEIITGKRQQRLRLLQLLDRGQDYDRASFELVA